MQNNRQEREITRKNARTRLNSLFYLGKIGNAAEESIKIQFLGSEEGITFFATLAVAPTEYIANHLSLKLPEQYYSSPIQNKLGHYLLQYTIILIIFIDFIN